MNNPELQNAIRLLEESLQIRMAGDAAEKILLEREPNASLLKRVQFHEAAHVDLAEHHGRRVYAVEFRDDGAITHVGSFEFGAACCPSDMDQITKCVETAAACDVPIDLDHIAAKTEELVRASWSRIERIARHLASCCSSGISIMSGETLRRLFWTSDEWRKYEEGLCVASS